jgi:hypothetical protein
MNNLYRGPSIDASYQVSDQLDKWFQRRRFLEKQELPMVAILLMDRPLTFHILIFSSETAQPNEVKLGRKHYGRSSKECTFCYDELSFF